jgi:branched-chain amino acid transport system ATP-binding protein
VTATSPTGARARPVIELDRVRACHGNVEVLHDVSLTVTAGSVFAVLGPNGAGKTTMLSVVAGLVPTTGGRVLVTGTDVGHLDATTRARLGICLVPEGRGVFPNLTVAENLWMMTHLGTSREQVEERAYARFPRLAERRTQLAGTMSGGEQQMLALARALVTDPAILLLDELSMGLAPKIVAELYDLVVRVAREEHLTIVLVEQFARTVLSVADRAALVAGGRVLEVGTPDEIESDLQSAYLGGQNHPVPHHAVPHQAVPHQAVPHQAGAPATPVAEPSPSPSGTPT